MINFLLNILTYQNNDKNKIYFSNMRYVVYYYFVEFQLKTPSMYREMKKTNFIRGNLNQKS